MTTPKINISLTPYNALVILRFVREFVPMGEQEQQKLKSLADAIDAYQEEIVNKCSHAQLNDAFAEGAMHEMLGNAPTEDDISEDY